MSAMDHAICYFRPSHLSKSSESFHMNKVLFEYIRSILECSWRNNIWRRGIRGRRIRGMVGSSNSRWVFGTWGSALRIGSGFKCSLYCLSWSTYDSLAEKTHSALCLRCERWSTCPLRCTSPWSTSTKASPGPIACVWILSLNNWDAWTSFVYKISPCQVFHIIANDSFNERFMSFRVSGPWLELAGEYLQ